MGLNKPIGFMQSSAGGGTIISSDTLATGLVSYHSLDNSASDEISSSYDMTLSGAVFTASGKIDYGVQCDGSNDYMYQANPFSAGTGDCSTNFWIKADNTTQSGERAVIGAWGSKNWILWRFNTSMSTMFVNIVQDGDYVRDDDYVAHGMTITDWNMLTLTFDASTGTAKIYQNGTYVRDLPTKTASTAGGRQYIQWGCYGGSDNTAGTSRFFDGTMDEIGCWNKVLTTDEITELYNSGSGLPYD